MLPTTGYLMHLGVRDIAFPPLFALLILSLALNNGPVARLLAHPVLLWLGAISYSLYLSHMLILSLVNVASLTLLGKTIGRYLDAGASLLVLATLLVLVLVLSDWLYKHVEVRARTILRRGRLARRYIYR